ncbi:MULTISPECIES: MbtH family protein [Streptomyces]|uniref:MbtH protein n=2 Tax=Streptomyces TaxID=1883 RepID=A0A286DZQ0_9ACTN|nr:MULTISPECIES: MbtH family NRPS accessory protein [Streptomyces]TNM28146.1 MbtH family NRPS accessory protein [Streptomyces sedi]SOD64136.1 MbtH protein [Streptomyces zhaozhouensis]
MGDGEDEHRYLVVRNDEEQYSLWRADRELPLGWYAEGTEGTREQCLAHVGEIWTDMRPASLRRRMAETESAG